MEQTEKITAHVNFGGFYHSIHSELVDSTVESFISDEKEIEEFNWKEAYKKYTKEYISKLEDFIGDELEMEKTPTIEFTGLISPQYYNYTTDKAKVDISEENSTKIILGLTSSELFEEFKEYLKERTTSGPGYTSFFTYEEALQNKDEILIEYILEFMAGQYNENQLVNGIHEINVYETIF